MVDRHPRLVALAVTALFLGVLWWLGILGAGGG
jgi:hypothetical protein